MPFKQMENISNFLAACRKALGMRENDLFTSADLCVACCLLAGKGSADEGGGGA
jgi:hypothetical protein